MIAKQKKNHLGIPGLIDIDFSDVLKQKHRQGDDKYKFVHTIDKCFIKQSDPPEKISQEQCKKDGHGNIQTENKIVHKRKPPVVKFLCLLYPNHENCQTRYTGLEISGMIKSVAKKAAQGLGRRKERKMRYGKIRIEDGFCVYQTYDAQQSSV